MLKIIYCIIMHKKKKKILYGKAEDISSKVENRWKL